MSGSAEASSAKEAGLYLSELLKGDPYRSRWNRPDWMMRGRESELHHAAVAHVLEEYLHVHPREGRQSDTYIEYVQLASLVSNALTGKRLSGETLEVFIGAFRMLKEHADRLFRIHSGAGTIHLVSNVSAVPLDTVSALRSRNHITRYVHDHHYLGSGGLPYRHETFQVIEATTSGVDRYVYAFDTDHLTVEALTGETLSAPYAIPNDLHAVDIIFDHPLRAGELHIFKYETTFRYKSQPSPEFRRLASVRLNYAEVKVTFHPARLPKEIREADWKDIKGPNKEITVTPDGYHSVTRSLRGVENSGYGYIWKWR